MVKNRHEINTKINTIWQAFTLYKVACSCIVCFVYFYRKNISLLFSTAVINSNVIKCSNYDQYKFQLSQLLQMDPRDVTHANSDVHKDGC